MQDRRPLNQYSARESAILSSNQIECAVSMSSSLILSIVIVNWNTCEFLRNCLRSIMESEVSDKFETVVVDNASSDGSAEMVRKEFPAINLLAQTQNFGYARGNNEGIAATSGEFVLTLNPDTTLEPGTLRCAIHAMRVNPKYGACGAKQVGIDGAVQRSVRGFPSVLGIFGDATGLGKRFPGSVFDSYRLSDFDYDSEGLAPQPMGTFLIFRREALRAIGSDSAPFDEEFPIFFNEVDLLRRLRNAGWLCGYDPAIRLVHFGGAGTTQVRKPMIWESHMSLIQYLRKHWFRWWNSPVFVVVAAVVWLGAVVRARGIHGRFRR